MRKKGSLTPFCALMLIVVLSLLLVLLESARVYGLQQFSNMKVNAAMDSMCAEFQPYLWQEYGVLLLDGSYRTEKFSAVYMMEQLEQEIERNCDTSQWLGLDLFRLSVKEVLLEEYGLITDDEGALFLNYIAEREKENLPLGIAEDLYGQYQETQLLEEQTFCVERAIKEAQETITDVKTAWLKEKKVEKEIKKEKEEAQTGKKKGEKENEEMRKISLPDTSKMDEILENASNIKMSGLLNKIFPDLSQISLKGCYYDSNLQTREKECGTLKLNTNKEWYQRMLVLSYLGDYFSNYCNPKEEHFFSYEMEYVICGKENEWENLEGSLRKILLIREAANVVHILRDTEKMEQIRAIAELIGVLAGGNIGAIKTVEVGLVGAWAYMESILDVRSIISGREIPLVKKEDEWTIDLSNLQIVFDVNAKAKECEKGLNYTDYLKQLLFAVEKQKLAYRMMEVMEIGLRKQKNCENVRMDSMVALMRFKVSLESTPLFSKLIWVGDTEGGKFVFSKVIERSYIP